MRYLDSLKGATTRPYFKSRLAIALILLPIGPFLVLWVASLGSKLGEAVSAIGVELMIENPWIAIVFFAGQSALLVGILVLLFTKPRAS